MASGGPPEGRLCIAELSCKGGSDAASLHKTEIIAGADSSMTQLFVLKRKQMLLRHQIEAEGVPIRDKEGTESEAGFRTLRVHQHQSTLSARGEPGRIVDPACRRAYSSLAGPVTTVAMGRGSDMVMVDVKSMLDLIAHQQQLAELLQPQSPHSVPVLRGGGGNTASGRIATLGGTQGDGRKEWEGGGECIATSMASVHTADCDYDTDDEMRRRVHDLRQQARELDSKLAGKIELLRLATCKVTNLLSHLAELEEEEDARETPPPLVMRSDACTIWR
mmetsp:Transcript_83805/g.122596  ORF Transcript_83805/g.122596 Transcript_83805/m.122596 type:complete len:277 (+) Transcript_83805:36-866(+)